MAKLFKRIVTDDYFNNLGLGMWGKLGNKIDT